MSEHEFMNYHRHIRMMFVGVFYLVLLKFVVPYVHVPCNVVCVCIVNTYLFISCFIPYIFDLESAYGVYLLFLK